jgi:DNA-binding transcriptional regulator YiaG
MDQEGLSPFIYEREDILMSIKELRELSGMTQKVFGEYFGIPKRTVEDWECGRRSCNEYLLRLMYYKMEKEGVIKVDK